MILFFVVGKGNLDGIGIGLGGITLYGGRHGNKVGGLTFFGGLTGGKLAAALFTAVKNQWDFITSRTGRG